MTETTLDLDELAASGFTEGHWNYRPNEHDDWGTVRTSKGAPGGFEGTGAIICRVNSSHVSEETKNEFRRRRFSEGERCDPVEATARLIAAAPSLLSLAITQRDELIRLEADNAAKDERIAELESRKYGGHGTSL